MILIKKFATVASGTLMSRIFGFIREMLMAAALGTGPVSDAFNAAFRFPNTFRRFLRKALLMLLLFLFFQKKSPKMVEKPPVNLPKRYLAFSFRCCYF